MGVCWAWWYHFLPSPWKLQGRLSCHCLCWPTPGDIPDSASRVRMGTPVRPEEMRCCSFLAITMGAPRRRKDGSWCAINSYFFPAPSPPTSCYKILIEKDISELTTKLLKRSIPNRCLRRQRGSLLWKTTAANPHCHKEHTDVQSWDSNGQMARLAGDLCVLCRTQIGICHQNQRCHCCGLSVKYPLPSMCLNNWSPADRAT